MRGRSLCRSLAAPFMPAVFAAAAAISVPSTFSARAGLSAGMASVAGGVMEKKRALRADLRRALKELSPEQRSQEDEAIQGTILNSDWFKSSKSLCAYISCEALREVDTSRILAETLQLPDSEHHTQMKVLYVPWVEDKNRNMRMIKITSMKDLIANSMNILEPSPLDAAGNNREDVMVANQPVDLFLLPGVAFDRTGRRLGRGGGYYDTFLKRYQDRAAEKNWNQPLLVALAYSAQIMEDGVIPVTPTDIPIDALVSPSGVIPISPAARERM